MGIIVKNGVFYGDTSSAEAKALAAFPTDTVSGAAASFPDGADGLPVKSLSVEIAPTLTGRTGLRLFNHPFVRSFAGKTPQIIGSEIADTWKDDSGTSYSMPWIVTHLKADGSAFLEQKYATIYAMPFDAPEAVYYAGENGLAAGQYYISIGRTYGSGWTTDKHINFTLTSAMAAGDQLVIDCGANNANDPSNGRTWNVYAMGSTTSKQSGTTSNSTEGTELGVIGNESVQKPNGPLNAITRVLYGSGRWSQSAIRQWLNSEAAAGAWWTARNPWDRPPAEASTRRGFLAGCSEGFLSALEPVEVVTALNTVEGYASVSETTTDRIFLPSLQEMYIRPLIDNVEGQDWDYYRALAQDAGLSDKFEKNVGYEILEKHLSGGGGAYIWLRSSPLTGAYNAMRIVNGSVTSGVAYYPHRVCPACKLRNFGPQKTLSWQTQAGTVYGGTLDVTTGLLTVTHGQIASYAGESVNGPWLSSLDTYSAGATPSSGAQVVYPLETPVTYRLTPQELDSLLGQNGIFADCGNVSVTYRADPVKYIDKKLAEIQALILENNG